MVNLIQKLESKMNNKVRKSLGVLSYRLLNGYALSPRNVIFEVTHRCNERCKMCLFYSEEGIKPYSKPEISLHKIEKIVSDICWFFPRIIITGGEPLMRSDILEILQLLKRKNLRYSLLTNGTLIDNEKARKLVNLDPESIGISLDGPEKVHEMIRGPGTFNKTVKGIELLKRNGYSRVKINCSISRMNFESLEYLVDIANDLGVTLQYQHLMFTEKRRDNEHRKMIKKYFDFDSEDRISGSPHEMQKVNVDTLIEQITKIKNLHSGIKFKPDLSLTEIKKYYLDLKDYTHAKYCLYPWNVARINPQGEVPYCIMGYTAGTLLDSSFADVWNSENMQYFRRVLKEVKLFPNCVRCGKI